LTLQIAFSIEQLTLTTEHGRAVARGRIERTPELSANLAVDVEDLDPAVFVTAMTGAVSGHLALRARNEDLRTQRAEHHLNGAQYDNN
jgi:autotransporter translocation and assembly factor TamB